MSDKHTHKLHRLALELLAQGQTLVAAAQHAEAAAVLQRSCAAYRSVLATAAQDGLRDTMRLEHARALVLAAFALGRCWKLRRALDQADRAIVALLLLGAPERDLPARQVLAEALNTRGEVLTRLEHLAQAQDCHDRALQMLTGGAPLAAISPSLRTEAGRALVGRGNVLADGGDLKAAMADYRTVVDAHAAGALEAPILAARAATNLANAEVELGQADEADRLLSLAASLYEAQDLQRTPDCRPMLGHTLRCHAQALFLNGRLEASIAVAGRAIEIFAPLCERASDDATAGVHFTIDLVRALSIQGRAHTRAGRPEAAEGLQFEAARRLSQTGPLLEFPPAVRAQIEVDLGNALADQGRSLEARRRYERAIAIYASQVRAGRAAYRAGLARARTNLGNALLAAGQFDPALQQLAQAERDYDRLITGSAAHALQWAARAHTRVCLAQAEYLRGAQALARRHCRRSLDDYEDLFAGVPLRQLHALHARAQTLMARIEIADGNVALALLLGREAWQRFRDLLDEAPSPQLQAEQAASSIVLANALSERSEFGAAAESYRNATGVLQQLVDVLRLPQYEPELARAETNLGNALRRSGSPVDALPHLQAAVNRLEPLVRTQALLRGRLGHAMRCLADALADAGRLEPAERTYRRTVAMLQGWRTEGDGRSHGLEMAAALSRLGRLQLAREAYVQAAKSFEDAAELYARIDGAGDTPRVEHAHALVNQGLAHLGKGDMGRGLPLLRQVWELGLPAVSNGSLAMSGPVLRSLCERLRLCWHRPASRQRRFDQPHELAHLVDAFSTEYLDRNRGQLRAIELFVELLGSVQVPGGKGAVHRAGARPPGFDQVLLVCLRWKAVLARDADPSWLAQRHVAARVASATDALQRLALASEDLVADWYLHSFGLRSLRHGLRDDPDPDAQRLGRLLDDYDATARGELARSERRSEQDGAAELADPADEASRRKKLLQLQEDIRQQRRRLNAQHSTALSPVLSLADITQRLAAEPGGARQALLLLCLGPAVGPDTAGAPTALWIITIGRATGARPSVALQRHALPLAPWPDTQGEDGPRDEERWAVLYQAMGEAGVQALRQELAGLAGEDRVSLVPSPELCAMPWHLLLGPLAVPPALHVYPSIGAWWLAAERQKAGHSGGRSGVPRIALFSHDAYRTSGMGWLPFVRLEAALGRRLWRGSDAPLSLHEMDTPPGSAPPGPAAGEVQGLVAQGHGRYPPDGDWVESGVFLGGTADRPLLLTASAIRRLGPVRHAFINTCVLGRTRSFLGETLGPIVSLFDPGFATRTAIGAVHRIGDLQAALVSLAFQFVLRHGAGAPGEGEVNWLAAFTGVQRALHAGRWPDGFAAWLQAHLPATMSSAQVVPPQRRLAWYARLHGGGLQRGLFDELGLAPMQAGPLDDWGADLERLAAALAWQVPESVRRQVACYVAFGDPGVEGS